MGLANLRREIMQELSGPDVVDLSPALGCLPYLTADGRLVALESFVITEEGKAQFGFAKLNFACLGPLIERLARSSLFLEFKKNDPMRSTILMAMGTGETRKLAPTIGSKAEVIDRALDDNLFPVLVQTEVQKALQRAGSSEKVRIPIRAIRLRQHQPVALAQNVRSVALACSQPEVGRLEGLRDALRDMRHALRSEVLGSFMTKCVWLDRQTGLLGHMEDTGSSVDFAPFDTDEPEISNFQCALQKDFNGDFLLDFREFAHVLPTPKSTTPWLGPTLQIHQAGFRAEFDLDEFYSLHEGFRKLCQIGVPVLIFAGQNPVQEPSDVRFLRISDRSLNLLQGRLNNGRIEQDVRDFATEALLWR